VLADVDGVSVKDFVKRTMKFLLSDRLAQDFNLSGRGKSSFLSLRLFDVMYR